MFFNLLAPYNVRVRLRGLVIYIPRLRLELCRVDGAAVSQCLALNCHGPYEAGPAPAPSMSRNTRVMPAEPEGWDKPGAWRAICAVLSPLPVGRCRLTPGFRS